MLQPLKAASQTCYIFCKFFADLWAWKKFFQFHRSERSSNDISSLAMIMLDLYTTPVFSIFFYIAS